MQSFRALSSKRNKPRRLWCEVLEDRTLLSGLPVVGPLAIDPSRYDDSSIIVRFRNDSPTFIAGTASERAWSVVSGLHQVRLAPGMSVEAALNAYRANPNVLYAEPNYTMHADLLPNDPSFPQQWNLNNTGQTDGVVGADISAPIAWDFTTGSGNTIVAVIDTGIDYRHPDLAANMWVNQAEFNGLPNVDDDDDGYVDDIYGYDFVNDDGNPLDDNDHGTHIAGIIGAVGNNSIGVTGINWGVKLMALKFLDSTGSGTTADAIEALNFAVAHGATVSNNSYGGDPFSQAFHEAIENAQAAGHIFVAAAGNGNFFGIGQDNDANPFYPASDPLDNVVSVAASDDSDGFAFFSNYGATSVDLAAPGVDILSTTRNNSYEYLTGTSVAAPHVTGAIALLQDLHPDWDYRLIINRILETVDPIASLQPMLVSGGRLNLGAAITPDTVGPVAVSRVPFDAVSGPVSNLRVTFNESIQASSFTTADVVSFTGPNGAITVTSISPVAGSTRKFDITFASQTALGNYVLVIGPAILDMFGNPMDQDGDAVNGESVEDRYSATFQIVPFAARYDFGTTTSPVAEGYTGVNPTTSYSAAQGYGWLSGAVGAVDRGGGLGNDLTRDLVFERQLNFGVDMPHATYDVTLTIGDVSLFAHDLMGVFIEGNQVGTISTAASQVLTVTFRAQVKDGQLTFSLRDLGGSDINVVLSGLQIVWVGPAGPRVASVSPAGTVMGPVNHVVLTFDEAIQDGTFTLADVVSLTGPNGAITPIAVNKLSSTVYEVTFASQSATGDYSVTVGPDILDMSGNAMDQNGNGTPGEASLDRFTGAFRIVPFVGRFDFGVTGSPVAAGYTNVLTTATYSAAAGFGWLGGAVFGVDRGVGTDLTRDLAYGSQLNFGVDAPQATFDVTLTLGDMGPYAHDQIAIFLEGVQVGIVNTAAGQVTTVTYRVPVKDGQLTVLLQDKGGTDANVVWNALEVVWVGSAGPRVSSTMPVARAVVQLDRIIVNFDEPILDGTFTLADVTSLNGPSGAITPLAVNKLSSTSYEVVFPMQTAVGNYSLTVGPNILDLDGFAMDQDSDGTPGEGADSFTITLPLVTSLNFDFGVPGSPVTNGYLGVVPLTSYSAAQGFGWTSGPVQAVDRGTPDTLTRDLAYATQLNFGMDVPEGTYDLVLTLGDTGPFAHDLMGVFVEGNQLDTVSTAASQVLTNTYRVHVKDGQLTFSLRDLGGSDANAVMNGLRVVWVGPAGPRVIAVTPPSNVLGPVDRVTLTFDEPIQDGTFTLADVGSLTGPAGAITPIAVNKLSSTRYEVVFAEQFTPGDYALTIGPDILDLSGLAMDQNVNGTPGEATSDRFSALFHLVMSQSFDFGTSSSPVAAGFVGVSPATTFNGTLGYGWLSVPVQAVDRSSGTALTRDLVYERQLNFGVNAVEGTYDVTLTIGDAGPYGHDLMGVFLEGSQIDLVTTAAGQVITKTYRVPVKDGQLTLSVRDLGGSDPNAVMNGLQVVWVGPAGPRVVSASPAGTLLGQMDRFIVTFDEPIQNGTLTLSDVNVVGPGGAIAPTAVNQLSPLVYEVVFALQTVAGNYSLTVGPNVLDLSGHAMDQNGNGNPGEGADSFNTTTQLATSLSFDFGTSSSPVAAGSRQVQPATSYSAALGYGWLSGSVQAVDRGTTDPFTRDLAYGPQLTFGVNASQGNYDVTLTIGDTGPYAHDFMAVFLEGMLVDTVSTAPGQVRIITYSNVPVNDGQLTLQIVDQGGSDLNVVLNGLYAVRSGSGQALHIASTSTTGSNLLPATPPLPEPQAIAYDAYHFPVPGQAVLNAHASKSERRIATPTTSSLFVNRPTLSREVFDRVFSDLDSETADGF